MKWIKRAWRGEELLWKAFYYSTGITLLAGATYGGIVGCFSVMATKDFLLNLTPPTATTGPYVPSYLWWLLVSSAVFSYFIVVPLEIWQAIVVWRCSFNTREKYWGYIARTIVLVMGIWSAVGLIEFGIDHSALIFGNKHALHEMTCQMNMDVYKEGAFLIDGKLATKEFLDKHPYDLNGCIQALTEKDSIYGKQSLSK